MIGSLEPAPQALVSGGSGGIGAAVCAALAREGFDVALTYNRNEAAALAAANAVTEFGRAATIHQVDLVNATAVEDLLQRLPRLDCVVSAAGPPIPMRYVSTIEPELFAAQISRDAVATFNLLKPAIARLRESQGTIVCLVTTALDRYASRDMLSAAPKGAVEQVVRAIAAEEGRFGIRANCVGVGVIEAGILEDLKASGEYDERALDAARRATPLGRFGTADELASVVAFLAGTRSSYVTGQTLNVDGGYSV